jgi:competence protein ComEC
VLLIYFSCIWVAGIWLGYYFNLPPALGLAGLVPLLALFFTRRHRKPLILAGLGIVVLVLASAYAYGSLYGIGDDRVNFYNDRGVTEIKGTVAGDPDVRDTSTRLTLAAAEIRLDEGWREVAGQVLVVAPRYPAYQYGDFLHVTGELETPPQLGDFDYRGYLAHQGISATMYYPRIEVLDTGRGWPPLAWIYSLRARLAEAMAQVLPEPQAALAQGIVLGIRSNIPAELQHDFAVSGTAHLLAISGLHIGIMVGVLLAIGLWLFGRRHNLYVWLTLAMVWCYAVITGLNPPVVRGAIMASLFLLAEALGRQHSAMGALALAAAVMVGVHPYILGDASFQLSFLAMAGLVFIYPLLRDAGRRLVSTRLGEAGALVSMANVTVDTWSATLAAVIAVGPVVAYYFGFVSLVGPLATFLALPALPLIIVTGVLAGTIGLFWVTAAQVLGWLAWLFLSYLQLVVSGLAALSLASVAVGTVSPAVLAVYYPVLAVVLWLLGRRRVFKASVSGAAGRLKAGLNVSFGLPSRVKWLIAPLGLAAVLVTYTAATLPDNDLQVSFLDVGEGDAIFIQQGSCQVLVDGGPSPRAVTQELGRRMPFWDRTIDLLVLTHPHQDHLAGLVEVTRRYKVGQVLYPDIGYTSPMYEEWRRLLAEKGVKSLAAGAGQRIDLGDGVSLKVLNPPGGLLAGTESDIDNNSVVLCLNDGAVSFILTGDIMREAEWELVRERAEIGGTVIKVAHHGSDTSTTPEFLAVAGPRAAVISCGAGNRFGHPDESVVSRLESRVGVGNVFRTDISGTIDFHTDGVKLWVATER